MIEEQLSINNLKMVKRRIGEQEFNHIYHQNQLLDGYRKKVKNPLQQKLDLKINRKVIVPDKYQNRRLPN